MANSTTRRFSTGSTPGRPRQTGQVFWFGGAPNFAEQPQKIFDCGQQLGVHLEPDDGFVVHRSVQRESRVQRSGLCVFALALGESS